MVEKSYRKNIGKVTNFTKIEEVYELYYRLFSKRDESGQNKLDSSCEFMRVELLQYKFRPNYIALDLNYQFDEFHTYDSFYNDSNEEALKITDIWSFVAEALLQAPI